MENLYDIQASFNVIDQIAKDLNTFTEVFD